MSRILADKVTNYNNDGPFEAEQGINIPLSRPLEIGGFAGLSGQYLSSTGAGLTWVTFPDLFSGDYNDLTNKPVLFSGNFNDLSNVPEIPSFSVTTPTIGQGLTYNGAFWENVDLPTSYEYQIYSEQDGPNEVKVVLSDQFGGNSFVTFVGTNGAELSYNPSTDYIEIYSPNVVEYDAGTAKDDISNMFLNGTKIGISYTYNSITKTMDTVVNFPTVDTYQITGESSQANQARINLEADPSGVQGFIDIVGQDGVLISWDDASSKITLSKTPDATYTLPPATTSELGGVIADGTSILIDAEGRISASVATLSYDDFSVGIEPAADGNGDLSYDNTTGVFTYTPPSFGVGDLNDVLLNSTPPTQDYVLSWNGSTWADVDVNNLVSVSVNDISDIFLNNPQPFDYLVYNGNTWQNSQLDISSTSIHDHTDVSGRLSDNAGQILVWTGGSWESQEYNLNSISNVNAASPNDGDYLTYNQLSGNWETTSSSSSVNSLNDLSDVNSGGASIGDFIQWDGVSWQPIAVDLGVITQAGSTTDDEITAASFKSNDTVGDGSDIGFAIKYYITANGSSSYLFAGPGVLNTTDNPTLYFHRGFTYILENSTETLHPFALRIAVDGSDYLPGGNFLTGSQTGTQILTVPFDAPSSIVYQCTLHSGMVGTINFVS